jgi:hypothetical protein
MKFPNVETLAFSRNHVRRQISDILVKLERLAAEVVLHPLPVQTDLGDS